MSHQTIRILLALWDRSLKTAKTTMITGLLGLGLYGVVENFPDVRGAVGAAFVKLTQLQNIEFMNLKAAFRTPETLESLPVYATIDEDKRADLERDLLGLKAEWFARFLNAGALQNNCQYEHPKLAMLQDQAVDRQLQALGLIELHQSSTVKAAVIQTMKDKLAKHEKWDIGAPDVCFETKLTERGWNVRTAVVQYLTKGLVSASAVEAKIRLGRVRVAQTDE